jgi:pimeloyl-ACP methyl ester carboxylesterase
MYVSKLLNEELNLKVHYVDSPKEQTIILCHGFGSRGRGGNVVTSSLLEELPVNVATFCFPSHKYHHMSKFSDDPQSIATIESELVQNFGVTSHTYFGLSYGAFVALDYVAHQRTSQDVAKVILGAPYLGNQTFEGLAKTLFGGVMRGASRLALDTLPYDRMQGKLRSIHIGELLDYCVRDVPMPREMHVLGLHTNGHTFLHNFFARKPFVEYIGAYGGEFVELKPNELTDALSRKRVVKLCEDFIFRAPAQVCEYDCV